MNLRELKMLNAIRKVNKLVPCACDFPPGGRLPEKAVSARGKRRAANRG